MIGGGGTHNLTYIGNNNQTYTSKENLSSIWPAYTAKPFYNYTQWIGNYNTVGSQLFGIYLSLDNYSKKKNRYAIHSQT